MATRAEIEALILEVKTLVAAGRVTFVPRQVNIEGMARLGVTTQEAEMVLGRLTINNYVSGPEDDHDGSESEVWIFGASVGKVPTYLKLKIEQGRTGRFVKCLSFHPARYELSFPFRLTR